MTSRGRNAPCPCGSGRKYKHCCLREPREEESAAGIEASAVQTALDHLRSRHRRAVDEALGEFFGCIEDGFELSEDLDPGLVTMVEINLFEWLLAEAEIRVGERWMSAYEILTGPGGPALSSPEREALRELAERPLRPYEVLAVHPNESVVVRDAVTRGAAPVEVQERSATASLVPGDVVGLRLVRRQRDGAWIGSGAIYPLPRLELQPLREEIREIEESWAPEDVPSLVSDVIVAAWLRRLDPEPPEIVDVATGERILLTTDHYRVEDGPALLEALAGRDDVRGDLERGWSRVDPEADRVLCSLTLEGDQLEVFCRTEGLADASRAWLEEVAGPAVRHRVREHVDPTSPKVREWSRELRSKPVAVPPEIHQELIERVYADWADQPIPALGDLTPRRAIEAEPGRERVVELLLSYEHHERRQAAEQGRDPASFDFLWNELAIERPD